MFDITIPNAIIKAKFPTLELFREGQSKINPQTPYLSYNFIAGNDNPRRTVQSIYSDSPAKVTHKDPLYTEYRYTIVVDENTTNVSGDSYIKILTDTARALQDYFRSDEWRQALELKSIGFTLLSGIREATINNTTFFEKRLFIDVQFNSMYTFEEMIDGFIEDVNYTIT